MFKGFFLRSLGIQLNFLAEYTSREQNDDMKENMQFSNLTISTKRIKDGRTMLVFAKRRAILQGCLGMKPK